MKLNKLSRWNKIKEKLKPKHSSLFTFVYIYIYLFVFLFISLHQIQIVAGKLVEGTDKGFYCMGLPDVGITTILWTPYSATLWAGPLSKTWYYDNDRFLIVGGTWLFLNWDGDGDGDGNGIVCPSAC